MSKLPLLHPAALLASLCLSACTAGGSGADSGWAAENCTVDDDLFTGLAVDGSVIATVPVVTWTTDTDTTGWLVFEGEDGVSVQTAKTEPTTSHAMSVRGLHAREDVRIRAYVETDSGTACSDVRTWTADNLPAALPTLEIEGGGNAEWTAVPLFTEEGNSIAVVDGDGEYVWYQANDVGTEQAWRVRQTRDGDGLLINLHPTSISAEGAIHRVEWDGTRTALATDVGLHTDFVELADGGVAGLTWDVREQVDGDGDARTIIGDSITEYPKDGPARVIWSVWDDFFPDLNVDWPIGKGNLSEGAEDWSHANGITYDEERDTFLVTVTSIQGVVAIDRSSGTMTWAASHSEGTLATADSELMRNPHSVSRVQGDEYLVFNRGDLGVGCSNATSFTIDEGNGTVTGGAVYSGQECTSVTYLGQADPLPEGGMFVVWTTAGRIERVDADQELTWALTSQLGAAFGFSAPMATLYP